MSFISISTVKTAMKNKSRSARVTLRLEVGSRRGVSTARQAEETRMAAMMKRSKAVLEMTA